jgi:hypothetical protein
MLARYPSRRDVGCVDDAMSQVIFQTTSKDGNDRILEQPEEKEIHMEDTSAAQQINAILKKYTEGWNSTFGCLDST